MALTDFNLFLVNIDEIQTHLLPELFFLMGTITLPRDVHFENLSANLSKIPLQHYLERLLQDVYMVRPLFLFLEF